jgi:hypothetical protein
MVNRALWLLVLVACQGDKESTTGSAGSAAPPGRDPGGSFGNPLEDDAGPAAIADDAGAKPDDPEPADPGKIIDELGAISAWEAVIDRAQLLARRSQHGVTYGRIGPAILVLGPTPEPTDAGVKVDAGMVATPYVWLVDDTEGNGTLGIRIELGAHASKVKEGDRVAVGGAWHLDAERRWYWKVDSVTPVPPGPASDIKDPPAPVPSHEIVQANPIPGGRMITFARDNDAVYFQLAGPPPVREGDGWLVADELGDFAFARLILPGERESYGGQDMRTPDERWQLKRAQTYMVRIGVIRKHGDPALKPGNSGYQPATIRARTAPIRL